MKLRIALAVLVILFVCLVAAPERAAGQGAASLTFVPSAGQQAEIADDGLGNATVTVTGLDQSELLSLGLHGFDGGVDLLLVAGSPGQFVATLTSDHSEFTLTLQNLPEQPAVQLTATAAGYLVAEVVDPSDERVDVEVTVTDYGPTLSLSITYDDLPDEMTGRVTPLFPGLVGENALGGSVTVGASDLTVDAAVMVALHYHQADAAGMEESDLRLMRFTNESGVYQAVGENDRGIGAPSFMPGDYGVDTSENIAWAVPDRLGSFVVGVPDNTLPSTIVDEPGTNGWLSPCGSMGPAFIPLMALGLAGLRRRVRHPD